MDEKTEMTGLSKEDVIAAANYLAAACDTIWRERNGVGGMAPIARGPGGRFKEEDLRKLAVRYLKLAVSFGDGNAMNALSKMYQDKGAYPASESEDPGKESVALLKQAAEAGNPRAVSSVGMFYLHKPVPGFGGDFGGMEYDPEKGLRFLLEAFRLGEMKCGRHVGLCYQNGVGTPRDPVQAYRYFCAAADRGDSTAKLYKADCLLAGEGVEQDIQEAIGLYRSMVERREHDKVGAAYALARIYRDGVYAEKDLKKAREYFSFVLENATDHEKAMKEEAQRELENA